MERLLAPAWLAAPPGAFELLLAGATPATRSTYMKAITDFRSWYDAALPRPPLHTHAEVDVALFAYLQTVTRSKAENTVAAMERCYPPLKHSLPWCRGLLNNFRIVAPIKHHLPMAWLACVGIAAGLAGLGQSRIGMLLMLQWLLGLRPSEALLLEREHLTPPSANRAAPGTGVVNLGAKRGTKAKRSQAVVVRPDNPKALFLVECFWAATPPGARLTNCASLTAYASCLRRGASAAGMMPRWTPHCPRAGWATESWLKGMDFTTLREAGRWRSDASLRIYFDTIAAVRLTDEPDIAAALPAALSIDSNFFNYWLSVPLS